MYSLMWLVAGGGLAASVVVFGLVGRGVVGEAPQWKGSLLMALGIAESPLLILPFAFACLCCVVFAATPQKDEDLDRQRVAAAWLTAMAGCAAAAAFFLAAVATPSVWISFPLFFLGFACLAASGARFKKLTGTEGWNLPKGLDEKS
jgi:hypothetical protein